MCKILLAALGAGLWAMGAGPISEDLIVRLSTTLTSTSKAGAHFSGIVTGCARADCRGLLPVGSTIDGFVREVLPVGFGVRRERATIALEFTGCRLPDGVAATCSTKLLSVDNARETVSKGNRIHGILAADHPHSLLGGVWFRPSTAVVTRSLSGLNGAGRMLYSGIAPHPVFAGVIFVSRLAVLRLPEPEIRIPAGTELIVTVTAEAPEPADIETRNPLSEPMGVWLSTVRDGVMMPNGTAAADIINFAFRGSSAELALAFLGAGWVSADPLNGRTFARTYRAFTELRPYPSAPVSPLRYEGRLPDMVFQKSFNSIAKRHHIRLWKEESPDGPVWLGAATHDVGIVLDWKRLILTHRIDREIDWERDKVMADLSYAGCATPVARVERPRLAQDSGKISTDGALYYAEARPCERPLQSAAGLGAEKKPSLGRIILRRTVLETRQYVLRGNAYYWLFRGLRSRNEPSRIVRTRSRAAD